MNEETYYRIAHDNGIPCPECGKKINVLEALITHSVLGGSPPKKCPHCNISLPFYEYRDYGVKSRRSYENFFGGFPEKGKKQKPLWMIGNE